MNLAPFSIWRVHNFRKPVQGSPTPDGDLRTPFGDLRTPYGHLRIPFVYKQTLSCSVTCSRNACSLVVELSPTHREVHSSVPRGGRTFCQGVSFFCTRVKKVFAPESFSNVLFQRNPNRFGSAQKISCTIQTAQDVSANVKSVSFVHSGNSAFCL